MNRWWNTSVLILGGLVLGGLAGITLGFVIAAPECRVIAHAEGSTTAFISTCWEFWLARYQSLVAGGLALSGAGITAFVVILQILRSDKNHREMLDQMFNRDLADWQGTDGSIAAGAAVFRAFVETRIAEQQKVGKQPAGNLTFAYALLGDAEVQVSKNAVEKILPPTFVEKRVAGARPSVAAEFFVLANAVHGFNSACTRATGGKEFFELWSDPTPTFSTPGSAASHVLQALIRCQNAADQVIAAANVTKPKRAP